MLQIENTFKVRVILQELFSKEDICSTFEALDPYAEDFYNALVERLIINGDERLTRALEAFPTLNKTHALRLTYAYFKCLPEIQAVILLIAKRGALLSDALAILEHFPPESSASKFLLNGGNIPQLPTCCAEISKSQQLRYRFARWAQTEHPRAIDLIKSIESMRNVPADVLASELSELLRYLKMRDIKTTPVAPEACL